MNDKPEVDTAGGTVVEGDLHVGGDFIGRDQVTIFPGLTRRQTYLLLAVLAGVLMMLVLLATGLYVLNPARSGVTPLPIVGDFRIAIAEIGEIDHLQQVIKSNKGRELAGELFTQIKGAMDQETALSFKIGLGEPGAVGLVQGNNSQERALYAQQRAQEMNANLLVFGNLYPSDEETIFAPELYIAPSVFINAEEAAGYYALAPIHVPGNILTNAVTSQTMRAKLVNLVHEYTLFNIGLGYLAINHYQQAAGYLAQADELAQHLGALDDRKTILLMLGIVANLQDDFATAYQYYRAAAQLDAGYARAAIGVGQALFRLANRDGCDADKLDKARVQQALEQYAQALSLNQLPLAEIPTKVALFRGHAYVCLARAQDDQTSWDQAKAQYERVLHSYGDGNTPLLRYLAAEAWGGLGLIAIYANAEDIAHATVNDLESALAAFTQAVAASRRPNRQAVFELWQATIQSRLGACAQAEASFALAGNHRQQYLLDNPNFPDIDLDRFYQAAPAYIHGCTPQ